MRFHGKVLRSRWQRGMSRLGISGVLLVFLMVAVAGCADAEPKATGEPTGPTSAQVATPTPSVTAPPSPSPADATDVEVVYASPVFPVRWHPGNYDPLWGDLDADAPIIDRLLRTIEGGTPVEAVETDEERIWTSYSSLAMNLRFRNGTTWSVRQLLRCDLTSEERKTNCQSVPDHWELLHRNQVILSTALTEWFERVEEYMPKVEDYEVPDPITLGEPFAISGAGYHEGDRVELSIKFSDESVMPLGEVPLEHGAFRWEGEIPETAPSGLANFTMQVLDGTEVVWGITVESVTIAVPTGGGAATGLLAHATWILELLDGRPLIEETFISLELHGDALWGWDGCNSFASQPGDGTIVAQANGSFSTPKEILRTLRGCKEPEDLLSDQADAYMTALRQAERFRFVGDRLEIFDASGAVRLVFLRQQPLPGRPVELLGTEWHLLPESDGEGMGTATLAFLNDRLVAGATACRDYVATYRRLQGKLDFVSSSRIGSRQLCSEDSRGSEAAFIHTLSSTEEYSVVESEETRRLSIRTSVGKLLVFEPLPPAREEIVGVEWSLRAFVPLYFVQQHPDGSGVWDLRDVADVLLETEITISFDADGLGGSSGCNSYAGPARFEDGSITVDVHLLHHTEKLCEGPDGLMGQEERYFGLVNHLSRYGTYGDGLFMQTDDDVFLLFQAK